MLILSEITEIIFNQIRNEFIRPLCNNDILLCYVQENIKEEDKIKKVILYHYIFNYHDDFKYININSFNQYAVSELLYRFFIEELQRYTDTNSDDFIPELYSEEA